MNFSIIEELSELSQIDYIVSTLLDKLSNIFNRAFNGDCSRINTFLYLFLQHLNLRNFKWSLYFAEDPANENNKTPGNFFYNK
jgi:hypothetical protein